jgi:hypothetical protein
MRSGGGIQMSERPKPSPFGYLATCTVNKRNEKTIYIINLDTKFVLDRGDAPIRVSVERGFRDVPYLHFAVEVVVGEDGMTRLPPKNRELGLGKKRPGKEHWLRLEFSSDDSTAVLFYGYALQFFRAEREARDATLRVA